MNAQKHVRIIASSGFYFQAAVRKFVF